MVIASRDRISPTCLERIHDTGGSSFEWLNDRVHAIQIFSGIRRSVEGHFSDHRRELTLFASRPCSQQLVPYTTRRDHSPGVLVQSAESGIVFCQD